MSADAPRFLFIHGAGGTESKWRTVKQELGEQEAIFVTLPGRGTDAAPADCSISDYADYLSARIDEEVIAVGHSMGGLIAIELARKNPNMKGLVLAASHYELPVHEKVLAQLKEGVFPDGLFYASYSRDTDPELLQEEKEEKGQVEINQVFSDFNACNEYTGGKEKVAEIDVPILMIIGEEDRLLPVDAADKLAEANGDVTVKTIEKAGHYVMLENTEAFIAALQHFRKQLVVE